jgi:hypothetical protein
MLQFRPCLAELTPKDEKEMKTVFGMIQQKTKGPFTINYCTCENGKLAPIADEKMRIRPDPCGELENAKQLFCSAYRNDLAKILAEHGLYIANIFSNEVFLWDTHTDHHRLAKGFILEKFYMETHLDSKLTTTRAYGGISGAEFEARYAPRFFQKYYGLADWNDFQHYLIQYELQRRFFARGNMSLINDIRKLSSAIYRSYNPFKPVRDLIHNQLSAGSIALIEEFRKRHPKDQQNKENYTKLIQLIKQMTAVDLESLREYLGKTSQPHIKEQIEAVLTLRADQPLALISELSRLMSMVREALAARNLPALEAVELMHCNGAANTVLMVTLTRLMELNRFWSVRELLQLQKGIIGGVYGAGLLSGRERDAALAALDELLQVEELSIEEALQALNRINRVVEWAQNTIRIAFWDVWEPWFLLFPDVRFITDDIIRSSPLLGYASLVKTVRGGLLRKLELEHQILDRRVTGEVRAVNPGLAVGPLVFPDDSSSYGRHDIVALESTNAELEPVAGIITRDEGNIVSHVQLLARSLGIPNAVFLEDLYASLKGLKGRSLLYVVTPMGRVILKEASQMDAVDQRILVEYQRVRTADAEVRQGSPMLAIDPAQLDLSRAEVLPLSKVRRVDSGRICGPKAAYLGELRHVFPENVSRGLIIPFGVFHRHFSSARISVPVELTGKGLADEGTALPEYAQKTYAVFLKELLPNPDVSDEQLEEWIKPRLEIIRHSIRNIVLQQAFVEDLHRKLNEQGLFLDPKRGDLKGVFIRSDTNVEDLPNFSGAGLNLTLFNVRTFAEVLKGITEVWASPFTYRAFSWRQTAIDDPNLVFPSIVLLESVPSDKSGVLITADVETGDRSKMIIATAEGVGGTVDGSAAETLLWDVQSTTLLAQFKALKRRLLVVSEAGGTAMRPATGSEYVLRENELEALVATAEQIKETFEPETNEEGEPLAWDIEYGFQDGKLYLFQVRPFVGESGIRNLQALAVLDKGLKKKKEERFSLSEKLVWHH